MKKLWTTIRHNQGLVIGSAFCLVALLMFYGCESQVRSLKQPGLLVNRAELKLELDQVVGEFELRIVDLDKQDEFRNALFSIGQSLAAGDAVTPVGIFLVLGNILGLAAVIDNRRKDVRIKAYKANNVTDPIKPPTP